MLIYNRRTIYKIRLIKNLIIGSLVLIILNLLLHFLFRELRHYHISETIPIIVYSIINFIIIVNLVLKLWPHIVFCEDCGNVLGNELRYNSPCNNNNCNCNRILLRPPLVGKTYKITHQSGGFL